MKALLAGVLLVGCTAAPGAPEVPEAIGRGPRSARARAEVRQPFDFEALPSAADAIDGSGDKRSVRVTWTDEVEDKGHVSATAQLVRCEIGEGNILGNLEVGLFNCWTGESRDAKNPCRLQLPELSATAVGIDANTWRRDALTEVELKGSIATQTCAGEATITRRTTAQSLLGGLIYAYRRAPEGRHPHRLVLLTPSLEWLHADAEPRSDIFIRRGPAYSHVELPVQRATSTSFMAAVPIRVAREWLARSGRAFRYPNNAAELSVDISVDLSWGQGEDAPLAMATATLVDDGRRVDVLRWVEKP